MDPIKTCSTCREAKPLGEFHRHRRDGLRGNCKPCNNARAAAWRKANRERETARLRKKDAKRLAQSNLRSARYIRAFGYFEGRPGWTSALAASLGREKRLHEMTFKNPALEKYIAEFA